jgi:hypothetical protein
MRILKPSLGDVADRLATLAIKIVEIERGGRGAGRPDTQELLVELKAEVGELGKFFIDRAALPWDYPNIFNLLSSVAELGAINGRMWELTDASRDGFACDYSYIVRLNDRRAILVKDISKLLGAPAPNEKL